jgi:predicted nucleic acid-binding protein
MIDIVIDTSVFVAAFQPGEVEHSSAFEFLDEVRKTLARVACPTLVLAESAGAIVRVTGNLHAAHDAISIIEDLPTIRLVSLDEALGREAANIAASCRLRGADSVYVAVAKSVAGLSVTLDQDMLARGSRVVSTSTPAQWLAASNPNK